MTPPTLTILGTVRRGDDIFGGRLVVVYDEATVTIAIDGGDALTITRADFGRLVRGDTDRGAP